jgi:hypothetical protein
MKKIVEYLRFIKRFLKERRYWSLHNQQLISINSMEEFLRYVEKANPATFLDYKDKSNKKRKDFNAVIDYLKIDLTGQNFLDIGPGYGDALDICYEGGAKSIDFIEIDPFFFTFNRLKPSTKGYNLDRFRGLKKLEPGKYSLIWVKGAFSADLFIKMKLVLRLSVWLANLELLASPLAKIIICPHWRHDNYVRRIEDVYHNYFTRIMLYKGYKILPMIKSHNDGLEYPITFYKDMSV